MKGKESEVNCRGGKGRANEDERENTKEKETDEVGASVKQSAVTSLRGLDAVLNVVCEGLKAHGLPPPLPQSLPYPYPAPFLAQKWSDRSILLRSGSRNYRGIVPFLG